MLGRHLRIYHDDGGPGEVATSTSAATSTGWAPTGPPARSRSNKEDVLAYSSAASRRVSLCKIAELPHLHSTKSHQRLRPAPPQPPRSSSKASYFNQHSRAAAAACFEQNSADEQDDDDDLVIDSSGNNLISNEGASNSSMRYLTLEAQPGLSVGKALVRFHPGFWDGTCADVMSVELSDAVYTLFPNDEERRTVSSLGLQTIELSYRSLGSGLLEVERKLHGWLTNPPSLPPLPNELRSGGGVPVVPNTSTGPSYSITYSSGPGRAIVPYMSDCYNSFERDHHVWQAWMLLVRTAVSCMLYHSSPSRTVLSLCSRECAQFAVVTCNNSPSEFTVYPLTSQLRWSSRSDRKRLQAMALAIATWLRVGNLL